MAQWAKSSNPAPAQKYIEAGAKWVTCRKRISKRAFLNPFIQIPLTLVTGGPADNECWFMRWNWYRIRDQPLVEPILTKIYDIIWRHWHSMSLNTARNWASHTCDIAPNDTRPSTLTTNLTWYLFSLSFTRNDFEYSLLVGRLNSKWPTVFLDQNYSCTTEDCGDFLSWKPDSWVNFHQAVSHWMLMLHQRGAAMATNHYLSQLSPTGHVCTCRSWWERFDDDVEHVHHLIVYSMIYHHSTLVAPQQAV